MDIAKVKEPGVKTNFNLCLELMYSLDLRPTFPLEGFSKQMMEIDISHSIKVLIFSSGNSKYTEQGLLETQASAIRKQM